ncbi:MAG TPA: Na/Pi symporter, partial [candidate division Zixibacteria bacterium]|nr:Na/Pi symporter [candidate division Zixibacteria bacterium]
VLLPLQITTHFLSRASEWLANAFQSVGGLKFGSPLKTATKPVVKWTLGAIDSITWIPDGAVAWIGVALAIIVMLLSLRQLVVLLRSIVLGKVELFFQRYLFGNQAYAFILGIALTILVQSSSITTSVIVPLVGAGILTVVQIYPYTLGANIGTTTTALLASLVTTNVVAVAVAFSHLLFNICGILVFWPLKRVPLWLADQLSALALKSKILPILYILIVFFALPGALIYIMR